ncbi:glycine--tRNA ligase [Thermoproteota archaeon]
MPKKEEKQAEGGQSVSIEDMTVFCKKKGFVFPNSEIYGGMSGFFDYGPLGAELKRNLISNWWKTFVQSRADVVGIDGSIITNPQVWRASGHVASFDDALLQCKKCKQRFRADHFIEDHLKIAADGLGLDDMNSIIKQNNLKCTNCKSEVGDAHYFNMMFQTNVGPVVDDASVAYLRPETAQLIFANFKNVADTGRMKLPFGIAQVGKAFRNEISPRDFLFRAREFEQMEIEFFIHPDEDNCELLVDKDFEFNILTAEAQKNKKSHEKMTVKDMLKKKLLGRWHVYWLQQNYKWFTDLGVNPDNLRLREHLKEELAFYSSACFDIEYNFPFGWKELHGNADRGQYDLAKHQEFSKKSLELFDEESKQKLLPRVIEPSQGVDRAFLVFLFDAYNDDKERGNILLKLDPALAPVKVAVFPLVNKENIPEKAREIYEELRKHFPAVYDKSGSIGRRYARNDEMGTPYCLTVDFDSMKNKDVTIRDRDSTEQKRVKISELNTLLWKLLHKELEFKELA